MRGLYKILIFNSLCLLCSLSALSAQVTVKGRVRDAGTGEDLIGVTILVSGQKGGAQTDYEGQFSVRVESLPATLNISYTGYESQEVKVANAGERLEIRLSTSTIIMNEAVVCRFAEA